MSGGWDFVNSEYYLGLCALRFGSVRRVRIFVVRFRFRVGWWSDESMDFGVGGLGLNVCFDICRFCDFV